MEGWKMEKESVKFYPNRGMTALLGIIMLGAGYILIKKVLFSEDGLGVTPVAYIFFGVLLLAAAIIGIGCLIKTFDPRPVVEFMPEGMLIRTFIFLEDFVPWEEVAGVKHEQHTQRVVSPVARVRVTSSFLRVYRSAGRSLAINLHLLNKRGDEFYHTLSHYLELGKTQSV
jgi:hypothetical protein